jgi:hypothetical protein
MARINTDKNLLKIRENLPDLSDPCAVILAVEANLLVKVHSTSKANQPIHPERPQAQVLFWGWWVLTHTITVAGVTAVALSAGYIPSAVTGWIGVGLSLSLMQQLVLEHYTRLDYWGWAASLGWSPIEGWG